MPVAFDGANRIITVVGSPPTTSLDIKVDVYSAWKEWVKADPANAKWPQAMRTIGGDPTVSGQFAGDIYFLINNWKLYIDLTQTQVTGILYSDNFDSAYFTMGGVLQYAPLVSSLVNTVNTAGGGGASAADVWTYSNRTLTSSLDSATIATIETLLTELWKVRGLDNANPVTLTDTSITVGGITITIGTPDADTTTLTRS